MDRKIKFRGRCVITGNWAYGYYYFDKSNHIIRNESGEVIVLEKSVGQYTGLKDKNGKEIYEGDIIKTATHKDMVTSWSKNKASFIIERNGWMFCHFFGEALEAAECEVIGNTYENSELLNTKE